MKLIPMTCPKCGATMELDKNKEYVKCQYCGETYYISEEPTANGKTKHDRTEKKVNVNIKSEDFLIMFLFVFLFLMSIVCYFWFH